MSFDLLNRGEPDRVDTGVVSANFFDVLGIRPTLGRTFVDGDDDLGRRGGAGPEPLRTGARGSAPIPNIVGQVFQMNDRPHTVVGVLPPIPQYPAECDVYMPTSACPFRAAAERRIAEQRRAFGAAAGLRTAEARRAAGGSGRGGRHRGEAVPARSPGDVYRPAWDSRPRRRTCSRELTRNARPMLLVLDRRDGAGAAASRAPTSPACRWRGR